MYNGKNENLYTKEYVNYFKKLGYNHICIYDNNNHNGQRFEDVLQEEIKINFVSNKFKRKAYTSALCLY